MRKADKAFSSIKKNGEINNGRLSALKVEYLRESILLLYLKSNSMSTLILIDTDIDNIDTDIEMSRNNCENTHVYLIYVC